MIHLCADCYHSRIKSALNIFQMPRKQLFYSMTFQWGNCLRSWQFPPCLYTIEKKDITYFFAFLILSCWNGMILNVSVGFFSKSQNTYSTTLVHSIYLINIRWIKTNPLYLTWEHHGNCLYQTYFNIIARNHLLRIRPGYVSFLSDEHMLL